MFRLLFVFSFKFYNLRVRCWFDFDTCLDWLYWNELIDYCYFLFLLLLMCTSLILFYYGTWCQRLIFPAVSEIFRHTINFWKVNKPRVTFGRRTKKSNDYSAIIFTGSVLESVSMVGSISCASYGVLFVSSRSREPFAVVVVDDASMLPRRLSQLSQLSPLS